MDHSIATTVSWAFYGLAALAALFGIIEMIRYGIGGALLFYLMVIASAYLIGNWVRQKYVHA